MEGLLLLGDDDENFPLLLTGEDLPFSLQFVFDGGQAIQYLSRQGKYADRGKYPFPDVVLLDLNMPRIDGFEFLEWIIRDLKPHGRGPHTR
jgi:CheY-like chemotaxis protein